MSTYTFTTEADRLDELFSHGEVTLDEIIERAVSVIVQNCIMELSFSDGSETRFPVVSFDSRYAA